MLLFQVYAECETPEPDDGAKEEEVEEIYMYTNII